MKNSLSTSDTLNKPTEWKTYYSQCEIIRSELMLYSKDLRFLQQLLNRYFDEFVKNENLDEMRESLMRFQDLCYNCGRFKKRVKDQQNHLNDIINGASAYDSGTLLKEQSAIEIRKSSLMKDFEMVKKEMFAIADTVIQVKNDNEGRAFNS